MILSSLQCVSLNALLKASKFLWQQEMCSGMILQRHSSNVTASRNALQTNIIPTSRSSNKYDSLDRIYPMEV